MTSWLFPALLAIGIWLMTRKRARWFFTIIGGLCMTLFLAHLSSEQAQSGGGGLSSTELLAGAINIYFVECLVLLGLACFSFKREKREGRNRNPREQPCLK